MTEPKKPDPASTNKSLVSPKPVKPTRPGVLIHDNGADSMNFRAKMIRYSEKNTEETVYYNLQDCLDAIDLKEKTWINVDGIHHKEEIIAICQRFEIHDLITEDIMNHQHRPKCEVFPNFIFVTMRMLGLPAKKRKRIVNEQVSFLLGDNWVLSFQVKRGDLFERVREILRTNAGKMTAEGTDYLMFKLMDILVDNYFYITEFISEQAEKLEQIAMNADNEVVIKRVQVLKKELIMLRRSITPLRELVYTLKSDETRHLINAGTARYFNDIYDHVIQAQDAIDTQRDLLSSVMDLYLSQVSTRMNQVMQVLTTIATIFIPLTFIVGVYGMNFDDMPELHYKYGYVIIWIIMVSVTLVLLRYFRKKGWI